jgi:hypothetical protein
MSLYSPFPKVEDLFFYDLTSEGAPKETGQVRRVSDKLNYVGGFFYGLSTSERIIEGDPANRTIGMMDGAPNTSYFVYLRRVEAGAHGGLSTARRGFHSLMQVNSGTDSRGMYATSGVVSLTSDAIQSGIDQSNIFAGVYGQANQNSTGIAARMIGVAGDCYVSGSFGQTMGAVALGVGVYGQVGFGYGFIIPPSGSYIDAAAVLAASPRQTGASRTIVNSHGVLVNNQGSAAGITVSYGLKAEAQSGSGTCWASAWLGGNSYHVGNYFFGASGVPLDPVHVKCGSSTGVRIESQTISANYAQLMRTGGNFSISVNGTDACALYCNAKIGVWQLGGVTNSQHWQVQNGADATCFTIYADQTWKFYGDGTMSGDHVIAPATDNQGQLGTDTKRFYRVRTHYIATGDLGFDDERCSVCKRQFTVGDDVVWRIHEQYRDEMGRLVSNSIPVHVGCARPSVCRLLFQRLRRLLCPTRLRTQ